MLWMGLDDIVCLFSKITSVDETNIRLIYCDVVWDLNPLRIPSLLKVSLSIRVQRWVVAKTEADILGFRTFLHRREHLSQGFDSDILRKGCRLNSIFLELNHHSCVFSPSEASKLASLLSRVSLLQPG